MNLPTALVLIALIVILALVGRYLVRQRKNRCGSGCAGCPYARNCALPRRRTDKKKSSRR